MNGVMKNPRTYFVAVKPEPGSSDLTLAKFIIFTADPGYETETRPDAEELKTKKIDFLLNYQKYETRAGDNIP
jgi:hypothetical protein